LQFCLTFAANRRHCGRGFNEEEDASAMDILGAVNIPGYWVNETSGQLKPAIEAYLFGKSMTEAQIAAMRAYLRQWIEAPLWQGAEVHELRRRIDNLVSYQAIGDWLRDADAIGIDPL
jgi:hypothetical protein